MSLVQQTTCCLRCSCRIGILIFTVACGWANGGSGTNWAYGIDPSTAPRPQVKTETALFAAGCFWSAETDFEKLPGVVTVVAGYSGGRSKNPTYEDYSAGGHREVILVSYDPKRITYSGLVEFLLKHVDPLDRGGTFVDRGTRYAPAIYFADEEEKASARRVIRAIDAMKVFSKLIALPLLPRGEFWPAEEYHQDYHSRNAGSYAKYRSTCGRDEFVWKHWGERANELTLPESFPDQVAPNSQTIAARVDRTGNLESKQDSRPWEQFQKPSVAALRKQLSTLQFRVTQQSYTEAAFKNPYWNQHEPGIYVDIVSGEPLFSSQDKFESGTGWPSFVKPLVADYVEYRDDYTEKQFRIEVRSKRGDSHLGHVFADGPPDRGGLRFCMNSASLKFIPKAKLRQEGYGDFEPLFAE